MNITVQKYGGTRPGPDIVDPLLNSEAAGTERGRVEINRSAKDRVVIKGQGPKGQFLQPGKVVEVEDMQKKYKGIVTHYSRTYNLEGTNFTINSDVTIETLSEYMK